MRVLQYVFLFLFVFSGSAYANEFDASSNIERLIKAIEVYQKMASEGPWPTLPKVTKKIEPGQESSLIPLLVHRLKVEGYLSVPKKQKYNDNIVQSDILQNDITYTDHLVEAVKTYQSHKGLEPDGVIGQATIDSLNISAEKRLCQLRVNLRRFEQKMSEEQNPSRYVRVNIPDYHLDVVEGEESVMNMKVVVGSRNRRTPIFKDEIEYLVMNPAWYVPTRIAVSDKLPKVKEDPEYLKKMGMKIYSKAEDGTSAEVDPSTVDWSTVDSENFNYKIVQNPGRSNALGNIKFLFPNEYNVYLHDTSDRYLFKKHRRPFSSGCVRLDRPTDMAEYVLKNVEGWDREAIEKQIKSGRQKKVDLLEPLPIHLDYITAWVDKQGTVQFRDDIYGHDRKLTAEVCSN